jgi:hypothetical protein
MPTIARITLRFGWLPSSGAVAGAVTGVLLAASDDISGKPFSVIVPMMVFCVRFSALHSD